MELIIYCWYESEAWQGAEGVEHIHDDLVRVDGVEVRFVEGRVAVEDELERVDRADRGEEDIVG